MLHAIGNRTHASDLVDMMVSCHHRIREHLALARRIAQAPATTTGDSVRGAATRVRKYFAIAFPLHRADEEEDVFPLLRGRDEATDSVLDELMGEHHEQELLVTRLLALCSMLERDPGQLRSVATALAEIAAMLEQELVAHLHLEERTVFPALGRLSSKERHEVVIRMRSRRDS